VTILAAIDVRHEFLRRSLAGVGVICLALFLYQIKENIVECFNSLPGPSVCENSPITMPHIDNPDFAGGSSSSFPSTVIVTPTASAATLQPCRPGAERSPS
jgi:hypothetical protein